ncbi:autotransporter outer membrane beta-barrel domain-containing protein [Roseimaritima ulvae]|nr:autotransporter outer membrane beta-barrel domain-containing protein [Roseimaritima ulvae]
MIACVSVAQATPPSLTINSSNSTIIQDDGNSGYATVNVAAGESLTGVNITTTSSYFHSQLYGDSGYWHEDWSGEGGNLLDFGVEETAESGTYSFDWYNHEVSAFTIDFIFTLNTFEAGHLVSSASQVQFQNQSYQFRSLSDQVRNLAGRYSGGGNSFDLVAVNPPAQTANEYSSIGLVSYEEGGVQQASYQGGLGRQPGNRTYRTSSRRQGGWDGWVQGYGIGGNVDGHLGIAGFDYGAGGTQLGLFRHIDAHTLFGFYGAYGYQNVNTDNGSEVNVNSGMFGLFLHRTDCDGNYYTLAGNAAYDDYDTFRTGGITSSFDGVQTGTYLERGWNRNLGGLTFQPNVALQYIWVHQDDHAEIGGASIDDVDAHSLRGMMGANFYSNRHFHGQLGWCWTPNARASWMHEFLDPATGVTGTQSGASIATNGLDMGRDWALLGFGLQGNRNAAVTLYANYDLQFNDRQQFHTGSGGLVWNR